MPNQDYDKNPKQTKSPKSPNRINTALMPSLPDLPRTIVGGNEKNYEDILERAFDPQNLKRAAELMKRPIPEPEPESIIEVKDPRIFDEYRIPEPEPEFIIEVKDPRIFDEYRIPESEPESIIEVKDPRIFDEYRIPEDSQQDDDKSVSAISQQISEQSEPETSQQSNIPPAPSIPPSPIMKIPQQVALDSTLEDLQSEGEESLSEVPQKIAGPTVSVVSQRDDHKSISAISQKISEQSEPETSQQSNIPPTSSISLSPIMEMPQQAEVQSSPEPHQQIGIGAMPKTPRQEQTKTVVSTPSQEDALPIAVSPQQVVMQFWEENMEQMALRALVQAVQQDNMQPVLETPLQTQAGTIIATTSREDTQPTEAPLQQADTQSAEENMEQTALQALVQVIQQDNTQPVATSTELMALQKLAQRAQPVSGAQQQNQNGRLPLLSCSDYIKNHKKLSRQTKVDITSFVNYINNMSQGGTIRECVVEWIGRNIAFQKRYDPNNSMSDDKIQKLIDCIQNFLRWTKRSRIDNNVTSDISINEVKNKANELLKDLSLIRKFEKVKPSKKRPATANVPRKQPAFLRVPPPAVNNSKQQLNAPQAAFLTPPVISPHNLKTGVRPLTPTNIAIPQIAQVEPVQNQIANTPSQQNTLRTISIIQKMVMNPVAEAPQPTQNGILTSQHFEDYINSGVLPKHTQSLIRSLKDYIINNGLSEKTTKDHIVYWIGCDVAYTCHLHPNRTISNDLIQGRIDQVKAFFSWTAENNIYNNIANDISVDAIKKIADALIMNPSLVQKMKEQSRLKSVVQQPTTANAHRQQPAFLRMPPPVINIPMQPTPGNRQPIQNNILTPQHFKNYINLHYLPLRNRYTILQLGIYITEKSSGQATRETIIYWISKDLAQNIYTNKIISNDLIQEIIDYITAFFSWAAENHIYNNIASNISIEDIKRKAYEILNSPSFAQAFAKVNVGKPRR